MTDPTPSDPAGSGNPPDAERPGAERADTERPDTERPDTEGAHVIARHGDPSVGRTPAPAGHPETHVEWVRPTDMAARAGARVMEKTADVNQDVHGSSARPLATAPPVSAVRCRTARRIWSLMYRPAPHSPCWAGRG